MKRTAVVIGSGPNGLAAGITLAEAGVQVEIREGAATIGGGTRSAEVTLPGFIHDLGSAVHPLAVSSPFFRNLPLPRYGLNWIYSPAALAHPFDDGTAVTLERDIADTAAQLGPDAKAYIELVRPLADRWAELMPDVLAPLNLTPSHPLLLARFGLRALQPAALLAKTLFRTERARGFFAGNAAHSFLRMEDPLSAAFGILLSVAGHAVGWPIPEGGSQQIAKTLAGHFLKLSGTIRTDATVHSLAETRHADLILCDVTPRQFLALAGPELPASYRDALSRYRYGPGVYKVDYALSQPIPWKAAACLRAGTVHLGGTLNEIAASERAAWSEEPSSKPFMLVVQPTLFDPSRAPAGKHTAWVYCHVPNACSVPMLDRMEAQLERFAPGFRDCVLAHRTWTPAELNHSNPNLVGGDINGGSLDWTQFVTRPTARRYRTPLIGVYLCSSSTPPGGGVHGMCGFHAAQWALRRL